MIRIPSERGNGTVRESPGAALHAALTVAARVDAAGKPIVVLLADTGERYITTDLFEGAGG